MELTTSVSPSYTGAGKRRKSAVRMAHGPRNDSAIELLFYPKALAGLLLQAGIPWWKKVLRVRVFIWCALRLLAA